MSDTKVLEAAREAAAEALYRASGLKDWDDCPWPLKEPWLAKAKIASDAAINEYRARSGGVGVKALEWEYNGQGFQTHSATSAIGTKYTVWEIGGNGYWTDAGVPGRFADGGLDGAKAAAQADFERRIRSALAPEPAEREAAKFSETLNFYISCAVNGDCNVPAEKLVEIQKVLRAYEALSTPGQGGREGEAPALPPFTPSVIVNEELGTKPPAPAPDRAALIERLEREIIDYIGLVDYQEPEAAKIRDAIAALRVPDWRAIATAPRDGRAVLAWADGALWPTVVAWYNGAWSDDNNEAWEGSPLVCWQPLPALPAAPLASGGAGC